MVRAAVREVVAAELQRLAGHDVTPGHDELHHYWTKGEGLALWVKSTHPFTTLTEQLMLHAHVPIEVAHKWAAAWFHEVLGFWPGSPHVGAVRLPKAGRSAAIRAVVAAELQRMLLGDEDDDPIGEFDDDTLVLLQAMDELDAHGEAHRATNWDPAKHPHDPVTGRWLTVVDRLKAAITLHQQGGTGKKHPFDGFTREQLRNAAKARGIKLNRGEDRDSIAAKLLADLNRTAPAKASNPALAGAKPGVTTKPGPNWPNGDPTTEVHLNGAEGGVVVHDKKTGGYFPFTTANSQKTPLGNTVKVKPGVGNGYQTEQSAVDAIVNAYTPTRVSGPGLGGLKLTELSVSGRRGMFGPARRSWEISESGTPIGTVHDFGYAFIADGTNGLPISQFNSKSQAIQALVAAMPNAPAGLTSKIPAAPVLPQGGKHPPEIQGALDILYGKDPKGHTMSRQLAVYGSLRRHQFDQLGAAEQQGVLADLAYIETNAKGANATAASKIIDRFTPPGTPPGTMPKPSAQIVGPANGKQTRLPLPQPGLLKQAANSGIRGDSWLSPASGGGGRVWGEYGSGGLLLRHVDNKGVERFLLTQRGPAISDPGKWSYPGGAFESREDFYQGATREVAEELGFTDADFGKASVHGYHVFERPDINAKDGRGGNKPWTYHSVAATVPTMLKPNLSTHHAQAETSDAKWLTRAEIEDLDRKGLLHAPVSGGKLQRNVMSLFDSAAAKPAVGRPGPQNLRPKRLTGTPTVNPPTLKTQKPSLGRNLIGDAAARDKLRQDVKNARKLYAGKAADDRLAAIGAMQGFDDTPTVVTKDEFDRLLKTGDYIEAWRGVHGAGSGGRGPTRGGAVTKTKTAAQVHEEFRSGPAYYGIGIYGNGYYFAADKGVARGYSDGSKGSIVRVLIPKKANIVEHSRIRNEAQASGQRFSKAKGASHEEATLWNEGRYAAAKGHDAIEIKHNSANSHVTKAGKHAYNVLNRSVLIVEEAE